MCLTPDTDQAPTHIMQQDLLLKGDSQDILIRGGTISARGKNLPAEPGTRVVDVSDCLVTRGFTDIHVHLREPGYSYKETILSGTMAAARGGYTTVCAMPNLNPVPDSPENLEKEREIIRRDAVIMVLPYASITKGRLGSELVDFAALKGSCVAFSDDGSGVQNREIMLQAMREAAANSCIIAAHCEDNSLLHGGYIHLGKYCREHSHKGICAESEWKQIERDLELSAITGCRYHVCHISTAKSVELIREAKASGVKVSCETAPHYLTLCDEDLREDGRFKMNPPLRGAEDREALIEGLRDGTIDAIATDHAPHSAGEKSRGLAHSAMGITGLETAFPVLYTSLVLGGKISLERLIEALDSGPRRIFGIDNESGRKTEEAPAAQPADLTVIDLNERFTIDSRDFLSMGRSTPFDGMEVYGRVRMTIKDGKTVWEL